MPIIIGSARKLTFAGSVSPTQCMLVVFLLGLCASLKSNPIVCTQASCELRFRFKTAIMADTVAKAALGPRPGPYILKFWQGSVEIVLRGLVVVSSQDFVVSPDDGSAELLLKMSLWIMVWSMAYWISMVILVLINIQWMTLFYVTIKINCWIKQAHIHKYIPVHYWYTRSVFITHNNTI